MLLCSAPPQSGFKLSHIENLGVTNNEYEVFDLSDNEIAALDNFPRLSRTQVLLLHNNRVAKIAANVGSNLPNLEALVSSADGSGSGGSSGGGDAERERMQATQASNSSSRKRVMRALSHTRVPCFLFVVCVRPLRSSLPLPQMLCNNRLSSLSDLDALSSFSSLRTLSLARNPVAALADYRAYVIHLLPRLHSLDFARVKPKEREAAVALFGPPPTAAALTAAAQSATIAALQAAVAPEPVAPSQAVPSGKAVSLSTSYAQPSSFTASAASAASASRPKLTADQLREEKQRLVALIAAASNLQEVGALQKQLETLVAQNS